MSLLLDALKKAADDKNKKSDSASIENDDVLDLNLDLKSDEPNSDNPQTEPQATYQQKDDSDNFPEVDKESVKDRKTPKAVKKSIKPSKEEVDSLNADEQDTSENAALDIVDDIPAEVDNTPVNIQEAPVELSIEEPNPETNEIDETVISEDKISNDALEPETKPDQIAADKQKHSISKIKNEQALSALINKSNQYSRKEKLRKNISIAILAILIMIGSGLYFYIQIKMSSQDLYIAQNNNPNIERNNAIEKNNLPATQVVIKSSAPKKQPLKAANITTQKPLRAQTNSISKPVTQQKAAVKPISIVRSKKTDPVHVLLHDAYNAFHKEDYTKSNSLYKKVLNRETKNRDALLGLAAIAIKEKRFEYARQKYQYLLKLNPRDSIALAGLSSIEDHINPQLNESQIKFMLKQQPDSAHLYFALGSQYSSQQKWAEAQSAFFSAWSAENKNADYAYNLAVSLDHLDKQKQALDFYKLSLKLKQASSGNFSTTSTKDRIRTLQESSK